MKPWRPLTVTQASQFEMYSADVKPRNQLALMRWRWTWAKQQGTYTWPARDYDDLRSPLQLQWYRPVQFALSRLQRKQKQSRVVEGRNGAKFVVVNGTKQ